MRNKIMAGGLCTILVMLAGCDGQARNDVAAEEVASEGGGEGAALEQIGSEGASEGAAAAGTAASDEAAVNNSASTGGEGGAGKEE